MPLEFRTSSEHDEVRAEAAQFHLSDLVRTPSEVVAAAEQRDVIIHRRGKTDLRLSLASRAERAGMDEEIARLFVQVAKDEQGIVILRGFLREMYHWMRFLPAPSVDRCVTDLLDMIAACAEIGNFSAYRAEVAAWRSTAEVYSDPELFERLSGPLSPDATVGPVMIPEGEPDDAEER